MKITPPWDIVKLEHELNLDRNLGRNSALLTLIKKGDLVCFTKDKHGPQKLVKTTHELQPYCHPDSGDHVRGMAVDEDDTVYVVTSDGDRSSLSVYSADGRNKDKGTLTLVATRYILLELPSLITRILSLLKSSPATECMFITEMEN